MKRPRLNFFFSYPVFASGYLIFLQRFPEVNSNLILLLVKVYSFYPSGPKFSGMNTPKTEKLSQFSLSKSTCHHHYPQTYQQRILHSNNSYNNRGSWHWEYSCNFHSSHEGEARTTLVVQIHCWTITKWLLDNHLCLALLSERQVLMTSIPDQWRESFPPQVRVGAVTGCGCGYVCRGCMQGYVRGWVENNFSWMTLTLLSLKSKLKFSTESGQKELKECGYYSD